MTCVDLKATGKGKGKAEKEALAYAAAAARAMTRLMQLDRCENGNPQGE